MIDPDTVEKLGIESVDSHTPMRTNQHDIISQLQQIIPNIVNGDNTVNIQALQDVLDLSKTTANNQGYELTFAGKGIAKYMADTDTTQEISYVAEQSKDTGDHANTQNSIIRGDNIDVLKILNQNYTGKIKMIYIDPPYNTKSENFVYKDNFKHSETDLIEQLNLREDTIDFLNDVYGTKTHSGWLSFMYPRLKLARNLLTDDGMIFISIDDNEQAQLKLLCDEIFGENNFVAGFIWRRTDNQANIGNIATVKEYILCYAKDKHSYRMNKIPLSEKALKMYNHEDEKGKFRQGNILDKSRGRYTYDIITPSGKTVSGPWMKPKDIFDQKLRNNEIYYPNQNSPIPYTKIYLAESKGQIPSDLLDNTIATNQKATKDIEELLGARIFDFSKPIDLVKHFLMLSTQPTQNDIILDFFAGSGTTAHAVMALNAEDGGNRKYIVAQIDEPIDSNTSPTAYDFCIQNNFDPVISSITMERIRRAGDKIKDEHPEWDGDIGFKVFALREKQRLTQNDQGELYYQNLRESKIDILYNMMVATGRPLHSTITPIAKFQDTIYMVNDAIFVVDNISPMILEEYQEKRIYLDAHIDFRLEDYLNLVGVPKKENIIVIY